jgi:SAM-dependent methyltransferase
VTDLDDDIMDYYNQGMERDRLADPRRSIEYLRTMNVLQRHLPPVPATVLDIGGGPGRYALDLAALGYQVSLMDPVPLHVDQARQASGQADLPLAFTGIGDARMLPWEDAEFQAVLMLGPLYHLVDARDRERAWSEARRVLNPGGVVVAAAVCRYYTAWEMLSKGKMDLPGAREAVAAHIATGQHRNPGRDFEQLFTTAYFHNPHELAAEATAAGLEVQALLAVEGPAKLLPGLGDMLQDERGRLQVMDVLRQLEAEPSVLGTSEHVLVVARAAAGR